MDYHLMVDNNVTTDILKLNMQNLFYKMLLGNHG